MKRTFLTLTLSFLLSFAMFAYNVPGRSKLSIKTWNKEKFTLIIDNDVYANPQSMFKIENLIPGKHRLIVKRRIYRAFGGFHTNILYDGYINIPASSKVKATVHRHKKLSIVDIKPIISTPTVVYHGNVGINSHGSTQQFGVNSHGQNVVLVGMPPKSFENLKYTIVHTSFDGEKLIIAKQAIAAHRVTSQQVLELMRLFSFDSKKLELAKFAYSYTIDKQNYYIVNNGFSFSSSVKKLNAYISNYHI